MSLRLKILKICKIYNNIISDKYCTKSVLIDFLYALIHIYSRVDHFNLLCQIFHKGSKMVKNVMGKSYRAPRETTFVDLSDDLCIKAIAYVKVNKLFLNVEMDCNW